MILRDPVHGLVAFEAEEEAVLTRLFAAREVQRLRRIRQLGLASLAFPGAEHTRFAHAIGAATVMQRLLARLRQIDHELPFWQRVTSERARDALAAAFLHDVGHGPFKKIYGEGAGSDHSSGYFKGADGTELWSVHGEAELLVVTLADDKYSRLVLGVSNPQAAMDAIRGGSA